jgi:hypothetical protein
MANLAVKVGGLGASPLMVPRSYATTFAGLTENPLRENGRWIDGGTVGIDWQDVRCTPGFAYGAGASVAPPYDDPSAVLTGLWGAVQTVELTVQIDAVEGGVNQEIEARLLMSITPHRIVGYEVMWSITSNTYIDIERWDGGTSAPDFHQVAFLAGGTSPQLQTGYRLKATVDATGVFRAYTDSGSGYVLMLTSAADTTYQTGAPGLGFFKAGGAAGPLTGFGITAFSATTVAG